MSKAMNKRDRKIKKNRLKNRYLLEQELSLSSEKWVNILLVATVILAFAIRAFYLNQNPPSLNQDEAMNGYNAYSISKTLRDSRGFFLPALMHGFGNVDFRSPLYAYLSVPFMWMMGLSETSTRLAALIFNVALIPIVYLFVSRLFNNKVIALLSAVFLAFNPWSIHYSRIGHEAVLSPFFYFLSAYFLYIALKNNRFNKLIPAIGVIFGISMYTYQVARMLSPILFAFICLVYYREAMQKWKWLGLAAASALVVVFPMIYASVINPGELESRFAQVSIFSQPNVVRNFLVSYFTYFSPRFLFLTGDKINLPGTNGYYGMFHWYIAPLLVVGLIILYMNYKKIKQNRQQILLAAGLLLLYPLPAALTLSAPHALRAYTLIPVFHMIAAIGAWFAAKSMWERISSIKIKAAVCIVCALPILYTAANFLHNYYFVYPKYLENYYMYAVKQAAEYIAENQDKYDNIYFTARTNQPFIYVLFYTRYDPLKYIESKDKIIDYKGFGRVSKFEKYNFTDDAQMPFNQGKSLFITEIENIPGKKLLKAVENSRKNKMLYIWE